LCHLFAELAKEQLEPTTVWRKKDAGLCRCPHLNRLERLAISLFSLIWIKSFPRDYATPTQVFIDVCVCKAPRKHTPIKRLSTRAFVQVESGKGESANPHKKRTQGRAMQNKHDKTAQNTTHPQPESATASSANQAGAASRNRMGTP
jgi:hypothetical protein